jgi:hypothetical protein
MAAISGTPARFVRQVIDYAIIITNEYIGSIVKTRGITLKIYTRNTGAIFKGIRENHGNAFWYNNTRQPTATVECQKVDSGYTAWDRIVSRFSNQTHNEGGFVLIE